MNKRVSDEGKPLITPYLIAVMILSLYFVAHFYFIFGEPVFQLTGAFGSANYPGASVFFPFLVALLIVNPVSKLISGRNLFNNKNLLIIYLVSAAASAAMNTFTRWVLYIMGLGKYAVESPYTFGYIYDGFSRAVIPKGWDVLRGFWHGGSQVPWEAWILPLILWTLFIGVYALVGICLTTLVRKRWEEGERLTYPAVQPVLELVRHTTNEEGDGILWKKRLLWVGVAISGFCIFYEFLAQHFFPGPPIFDHESISKTTIRLFQGEPLLAEAFKNWVIRWDFFSIGLLYFVDNSILFGWWFFAFINRLGFYFLSKNNIKLWSLIQSAPNNIYFDARNWGDAKAAGGFIFFIIIWLWFARDELKLLVRSAFGLERINDSGEGMSYRGAAMGFIFGLAFLIFFATIVLGVSLTGSILYFILFYIQILAMARTRVESGLMSTELIFIPERDILLPTLGHSALGGGKGLAGLIMMGGSSFYLGIPTSAPFICLEGWRMAGTYDFSRKTVTRTVMVTLIVVFLAFAFLALPYYYNYGADMTRSATVSSWVWNRGYAQIEYEEETSYTTLIPHAIGAAITGFFYYMRNSFIWWPIHPVGYLLGTKWGYAYPYAGSALIVWLIKVILFRWVGPGMYRKGTPLFIGIMLGETAMVAVTSILNYFIL